MQRLVKIRCYIKKVDDLFVGSCIDLCLSAQGDSFEETYNKLNDQIKDYLYDITEGELKGHFHDLFPRRAPLSSIIEYYWLRAKPYFNNKNHNSRSGNQKTFENRTRINLAT